MNPLDTWNPVEAVQQYRFAMALGSDLWVPASGGNEVPFISNGTWWLYVYNPATGEHGYLNMSTDIVEGYYR